MILSGLTQKEVDERKVKEEQEKVNAEAKAELAATDWRVIRAAEQYLIKIGEIPADEGRDDLRDRVKEIPQ